MKKIKLFIAAICFCSSLFCQNISIEQLDYILQNKPNDVTANLNRGVYKYKAGDYDGANKNFKTAYINSIQFVIPVYYYYGLSEYKLGNYKNALLIFQKLVKRCNYCKNDKLDSYQIEDSSIRLSEMMKKVETLSESEKTVKGKSNKTQTKTNTIEQNNNNNNTLLDKRDNKTYKTIKIGEQIWMAENLNYEAPEGSYSNSSFYGKFYNWIAAIKACPSDWHLPSDNEWKQLSEFLGGISVAGGKMKDASIGNWANPNYGADNSSKFTALPSGYRFPNGSISGQGFMCVWWSSTELETDTTKALYWGVYHLGANMNNEKDFKLRGFSVRCIKNK